MVMVVDQHNSGLSYIVDGQQRFTTLLLLLSSLRALTTDEDLKTEISRTFCASPFKSTSSPSKPKLTIRDAENQFFQEDILGTKDSDWSELRKMKNSALVKPNSPLTDAKKCLLNNAKGLYRLLSAKAAAYSKDRLPPLDGASDEDGGHTPAEHQTYQNEFYRELTKYILQYCCLVELTTNDEESAYTLFNSLNSRGMPLSKMDLLKSDLLGGLPVAERLSNVEQWEHYETEIGLKTFSRLSLYLNSTMAAATPVSVAKTTSSSAYTGLVQRANNMTSYPFTPYAKASPATDDLADLLGINEPPSATETLLPSDTPHDASRVLNGYVYPYCRNLLAITTQGTKKPSIAHTLWWDTLSPEQQTSALEAALDQQLHRLAVLPTTEWQAMALVVLAKQPTPQTLLWFLLQLEMYAVCTHVLIQQLKTRHQRMDRVIQKLVDVPCLETALSNPELLMSKADRGAALNSIADSFSNLPANIDLYLMRRIGTLLSASYQPAPQSTIVDLPVGESDAGLSIANFTLSDKKLKKTTLEKLSSFSKVIDALGATPYCTPVSEELRKATPFDFADLQAYKNRLLAPLIQAWNLKNTQEKLAPPVLPL